MKGTAALVPALALLLAASGAQAGARHTAGTKGEKPGITGYAALRTPFDCSGRDTLALAPGLVDTLRGDTTGGPTDLDGYACRPWLEAGPEHVYRLEVSGTLELWAGLREIGGVDLDLFLLDGCDTDACVAGENLELGAVLDPGTYYLVVDGFGSDPAANAGPYALVYETRPLGVPPEACATAAAAPLVCGVGEELTRDGTLHAKPDLVRTYACNPNLARGGEDWYAVTLLPGQALSVETGAVADSLDAVLWLFAGCGAEATCLAVADRGVAGEIEKLQWRSEVASNLTVYLAVDGARPASTETAGTYSLTVTCGTEVPTESTSFGALRALYR